MDCSTCDDGGAMVNPLSLFPICSYTQTTPEETFMLVGRWSSCQNSLMKCCCFPFQRCWEAISAFPESAFIVEAPQSIDSCFSTGRSLGSISERAEQPVIVTLDNNHQLYHPHQREVGFFFVWVFLCPCLF